MRFTSCETGGSRENGGRVGFTRFPVGWPRLGPPESSCPSKTCAQIGTPRHAHRADLSLVVYSWQTLPDLLLPDAEVRGESLPSLCLAYSGHLGAPRENSALRVRA